MSNRLPRIRALNLSIIIGFLLVFVAVVGLTLMQVPRSYASALAYYVAPTGSDTNPGTATAPFQTITRAASLATPGTVVHVAPGTYTYSKLATGKSGTAAARITYVSDVKWGAKVVGTGADRTWENTGNYVDIVGFDITNTYSQGRLGLINYGSYVRAIGNHVHDISTTWCDPNYGGAGIDNANFTSGSNDDVIGNVVDHIGPMGASCASQVQGIYHSVAGGRIENNVVNNISGFGIHLWHAASNIVIANNLSFRCGNSGIIVAAGDNPGQATQYAVNQGTIVVNNIAMDNHGYGISEYGNVSGTIYAHNDVYANTAGAYYFVGSDVATHPLSLDPQFVNFQLNGSGDYHLRSTSPLINAGTSMSAPSSDLDGNARPQGLGFDIGPYEYVSAGSTAPAPVPTSAAAAPATPAATVATPTVAVASATAAASPSPMSSPASAAADSNQGHQIGANDFAALLAKAGVPTSVATLLTTASGALARGLWKRRTRRRTSFPFFD
jgi:parallel beta-helix repeat protein